MNQNPQPMTGRHRVFDRARRWGLAGIVLVSISLSLVVPWAAHAADVGGWFSDLQKPPVASGEAECAQAIRQAAAEATASNAYRAALCYLHAQTPDTLAATAWLQRSVDLKFMPAERLLRNLQMAQAGAHSPTPHCHDLGEGRQICHGGAPPAFAATPTATPTATPAPAPKN